MREQAEDERAINQLLARAAAWHSAPPPAATGAAASGATAASAASAATGAAAGTGAAAATGSAGAAGTSAAAAAAADAACVAREVRRAARLRASGLIANRAGDLPAASRLLRHAAWLQV